jgi:hypothetical protein
LHQFPRISGIWANSVEGEYLSDVDIGKREINSVAPKFHALFEKARKMPSSFAGTATYYPQRYRQAKAESKYGSIPAT